MTIADAAKKYLMMVKKTRSTADIAIALEQGGLKHSSTNFPNNVRTIIWQKPDEFLRVPNGDWGLVEWYPGKGRGRQAAKPKRKSRKRTTARAPEGGTKTTPSQDQAISDSAKPARPQSRVESYIAEHPAAGAREIADALGIRIQTVALIMGKLRPKNAA